MTARMLHNTSMLSVIALLVMSLVTWMVWRHRSYVKDRAWASKCLVGTFVHKLTPSADTQASQLIPQTVSPPAPRVLITAIMHLFLSVPQTMSCPLQDRGVDRSIYWSVIKPGLSYTASQKPTCILSQSWVHEGIISSLIVITHTWRSRGSLRGPAHCWDANDIMLPPKSLLLPG